MQKNNNPGIAVINGRRVPGALVAGALEIRRDGQLEPLEIALR
jgi:hypothetical protein